jgi:hypothetical protein
MTTWDWLVTEFSDQGGVLQYLEREWLPLREQWADYCIDRHLNFSQSTTSQTEASNANIKSYLVTGNSDFHRLTKALKEMVQNQRRNYIQAVAYQNSTIKMDYLHQTYLGNLPQAISLRALEYITWSKRKAQQCIDAAITSGSDEVPACDDNCTTWLQFRLPCWHTIHQRLTDKQPLTLQDVDPRWLLDGRLDRQERYLRIRDPPPAERRRGRPKNLPIPIIRERVPVAPPSPVAPPGPPAQRGRGRGRGRAARQPGPPRGNASVGRMAPSIRRRLSQWEISPEPNVDTANGQGPSSIGARAGETGPTPAKDGPSPGNTGTNQAGGSQGPIPSLTAGTTRSGRVVRKTARALAAEEAQGQSKRRKQG